MRDRISVQELIQETRHSVQQDLKVLDWTKEPEENLRNIVRRYTAATAVNFTDWMGKTLPWARHEFAKYALTDNLRCETVENHVDMLLDFSIYCQAFPDEEAHKATDFNVRRIRQLLRNPETAGVVGLTIMALLENTSQDFIPLLEKIGITLGGHNVNLTYTQVHGVADIAHADQFSKALALELTMGYGIEANHDIREARLAVDKLLHSIFCLNHYAAR